MNFARRLRVANRVAFVFGNIQNLVTDVGPTGSVFEVHKATATIHLVLVALRELGTFQALGLGV